jgi:hypothetical protein
MNIAGPIPSKSYWNQAVAFEDLRNLGVVDPVLEKVQMALNKGQIYSIPDFPISTDLGKVLLQIFPDLPKEWTKYKARREQS